MSTEDDDILREFLIESSENLARLDQEMVELEQQPDRQDLVAGIFRTIHTLKGTCGFLGFARLEALAHLAEDILNELRQGRRRLDGPLTSLILQSVDAIKRILQAIHSGEGEGEVFESGLMEQLKRARDGGGAASDQARADTPAQIPEVPQPEHGSDPAGAGPVPTYGIKGTTLRVDVGLLDRLMNLVGELVLTRNQVLQYNSVREDSALNVISQRLNLITTELQEAAMKTRMQPIGLVWNKLPRMVRDLAKTLGKEIEVEMEGAGTELDRTIIEAITDPLTHIVRNSCDHGIEGPDRRRKGGKPARGRLSLRAYHEGGQVNIEIADDGAGIDPVRVKAKAVERRLINADQSGRLSDRDALNLVFLPGFSTAVEVTNVSGRGVGMDVVKTHIERIGGAVELLSEPGRGTTVRVRIPLTLAIIPGLVVTAGGERFVIPQINLHELIRVEGDDAKLVEHIHSTPVFRRRNMLLPIADLSEVLRLDSKRPRDEINIVVLQADEHRFGLIVDQIGDSQEIVVKPMGRQLKGLACYAGATIMGDGKIALILDVGGLGLRAGVIASSGQTGCKTSVPDAPGATEGRSSSLLLCRAGSFERLAIPIAQVARLEQIPAANVERAAGRAAVQYRQRILPLLGVAERLGVGAAESETLHVAVCRSGDTEFGLVVDEISDIIDETIHNPYPSEHPGLLGSAVIGGRVTDFLDIEAFLSASSTDGLARLRDALSEDAQGGLFAELKA
jgi:two-component system chemotaxis sensor kinase CheA